VAVKIKLKRLGKIRAPYYRIIVADARTKRDGRAIEEIGKYHPKAEPSFIEVDSERAQHWLSVGAQPTDPVRKILEITGDWQKFKGLPGAEGTLRMAAPKEDRKEIFAAAVKETMGDSAAPPKGKARAKAGEAKAGEAKAADAPAKAARAGAKADPPAKAEAKAEKPARPAKPAGEAAEAKEPAKAEAKEPAKAAAPEAAEPEAPAAESAAEPEAPAAEAPAAEAPVAEAATAESGADGSADAASASGG
jgi:small subunit ribosomal protein S16